MPGWVAQPRYALVGCGSLPQPLIKTIALHAAVELLDE
jgi:hypothetical protein